MMFGLGQSTTVPAGGEMCLDGNGNINWWYSLFHSGCDWVWNPIYSGTPVPPSQAMVTVPTSPTGSALTTPPASGTDAQALVDLQVAQGIANQQQNAQGFYNSLPNPSSGLSLGTITLLALIELVLFSLQEDGDKRYASHSISPRSRIR